MNRQQSGAHKASGTCAAIIANHITKKNFTMKRLTNAMILP